MHADKVRDGFAKCRRVGYGYQSADYYNDVSRFAADRMGRVDHVRVQMVGLCKNKLSSLRPKFVAVLESITCDVFSSPAVDEGLGAMRELCREGGEFENAAGGLTVKPTIGGARGRYPPNRAQ